MSIRISRNRYSVCHKPATIDRPDLDSIERFAQQEETDLIHVIRGQAYLHVWGINSASQLYGGATRSYPHACPRLAAVRHWLRHIRRNK